MVERLVFGISSESASPIAENLSLKVPPSVASRAMWRRRSTSSTERRMSDLAPPGDDGPAPGCSPPRRQRSRSLERGARPAGEEARGELVPVANAELLVAPAQIDVDGSESEPSASCDLAIAEPLDHEAGDVALAGRQPGALHDARHELLRPG